MYVIIAKKTTVIEETQEQSKIMNFLGKPKTKLSLKTEWYTESVVVGYQLQERLNRLQSEGYEIFQIIHQE